MQLREQRKSIILFSHIIISDGKAGLIYRFPFYSPNEKGAGLSPAPFSIKQGRTLFCPYYAYFFFFLAFFFPFVAAATSSATPEVSSLFEKKIAVPTIRRPATIAAMIHGL